MSHRKPRTLLNLETLEDRLTPSFNAFYSPYTDTWTLTQVTDDGDVTVAVTATNQLQVIEGANTVTFGTATGSLNLTMLNNTGDVTVALDAPLNGTVSVNLGNGARSLSLTDGSIGGNLFVNAGTGAQVVALGTEGDVSIGGTFSADLGLGNDTVAIVNTDPTALTPRLVTIGKDFTMRNVNFYDPKGTDTGYVSGPAVYNPMSLGYGDVSLTVGGNLSMYVNGENERSFYDFTPVGLVAPGGPALPAGTVIGGNFTYYGSNAEDDVFLSYNVVVGGNVYINVANNINTNIPGFTTPNGIQTVAFFDPLNFIQSAAVFGGNVTVMGGANVDEVISSSGVAGFAPATVFGGSIYVNTGTAGNDTVTLGGILGGRSVTVMTGLGNDSVTYSLYAPQAYVSVALNGGNDTFTLGPKDVPMPPVPFGPVVGTAFAYLSVDFGFGIDTFVNNYGAPFSSPVFLRNLP